MDESRMIRSRVKPDISISDLTVLAELAVYSFDTDCVEREINEYCLKNASIEAKNEVESGDFIEFTVNGGEKRLPATVGLGLLGKRTESDLLGLHIGDTLITEESPHGRRELKICSIKRRVLPTFSDQAAIDLGYASVAEFRRARLEALRSQVRREKARELALEVCMSRISQLTLEPWETELDDLIRSYQAINDELFGSRNMDPAMVGADELEQMFGVRSMEELDKKTAESAETNLKLAIIGQKVALERGMSFNEEDYEQTVRAMAQKYLMEETAVRNATPFKAALVEKYVKLLISEQIASTEASMKEV